MTGTGEKKSIQGTSDLLWGGSLSKRLPVASVVIAVLVGILGIIGHFAFSTNSQELPEGVLPQVPDNSADSRTAGNSPLPRELPAPVISIADPPKPVVLQALASSGNSDHRYRSTHSPSWIWLSSDAIGEVTGTAAEAFEQATQYVLGEQPRQKEALVRYQRVLDANPPRQLELHVKLTMGARMTILYNPDLGEDSLDDEAIRWYEQIVHDFNDWGNHHDLMVAKIHLGDLYCMRNHGLGEVQKATDLCWQVIEVPKEEIVFDNPEYDGFNMDSILSAKAPGRFAGSDGKPMEPPESVNERHREFLLRQREGQTDRLRLAAIRSLAYKQHIPDFPVEVAIDSLLQFKGERPDDELYQETLSDIIEDFKKEYQSHIDAGFDEALDAIEDIP